MSATRLGVFRKDWMDWFGFIGCFWMLVFFVGLDWFGFSWIRILLLRISDVKVYAA
jgi:membrane-bound ClpP family serine protease